MAQKRTKRRWVRTVKTDSTHPPPQTFSWIGVANRSHDGEKRCVAPGAWLRDSHDPVTH